MAKNTVISTVMPELRQLWESRKNVFSSAAREIQAALDHSSFSDHVAEDPVVWDIIYRPILTEVDYELERDYVLASLLGPIMAIIAADYDTRFCVKMLEARVTVGA